MSQREAFEMDGKAVLLELDHSGGVPGHSCITIRHDDDGGWLEEIPIPALDDRDLPHMRGSRVPDMSDLRRLAMLKVTYWPVLQYLLKAMDDDARLELADSVNMKPPADESEDVWHWLAVVQKAVEAGLVSDAADASQPGAH